MEAGSNEIHRTLIGDNPSCVLLGQN